MNTWNELIACQNSIIELLDEHLERYEEPGLGKFHQPENGWTNLVWRSEHIRRAHIDVVDARETRGLWMMHVCLFPTLDNNGPIYGFDVIAGKSRITGAFHDFSASSGGKDHPLIEWFAEEVESFIPTKQRELPEWAKNIFSDSMVAAGNIKTPEEAQDVIDLAVNNLDVYLKSISEYAGTADRFTTAASQDYYCENQKLNPHTPRVMKSLGLDEADVDEFCSDLLFPTIV
jgi:hypothetical protein|tara:strand:- start:1412 stop:2104 length:693 start_codon:yes stop_codon:yes gene_type:complete